jgi:hypothetical protein
MAPSTEATDDLPFLQRLLLSGSTSANAHAHANISAVSVSVLLLPASPDFLRFQGRLRIEATGLASTSSSSSHKEQVCVCCYGLDRVESIHHNGSHPIP